MEYIKTIIVGVGYKDLQRTSSSQHFFAEVVLIDKTQEALSPALYQLKKEAICGKDDLTSLPRDFASMQRDAFLMVGEVVHIDKKKKFINLSNGDTVSYNHLIVASGKNGTPFSSFEQNKEFSDALQALIDALKIKKNIANAFNNEQVHPKKSLEKTTRFTTLDSSISLNSKEINDIISHRILHNKGGLITLSLDGRDKSFYEVIV